MIVYPAVACSHGHFPCTFQDFACNVSRGYLMCSFPVFDGLLVRSAVSSVSNDVMALCQFFCALRGYMAGFLNIFGTCDIKFMFMFY